MRGRNSHTIIIGLLIVVFTVQGCALLQNTSIVELTPARLTCQTNPEFVDGDLQTVGEFRANGSIRQMYHIEGKPGALTKPGDTVTTHSGTLKTKTLIKLDKPTYVSYVEIYADSEIPKITLDLTTEEKSPKWANSFIPVKDKRYTNIKERQVERFYIRQEVLYLRITADGIVNRGDSKSTTSDDPNFTHEFVTPLQGAKIREVKIYERM